MLENKKGFSEIFVAIFIILIAGVILFLVNRSENKDVEIVPHIKNTQIGSKYPLSYEEPKYDKKDAIYHYSPDKKHYLVHISPDSNANGSYIVLYDSDGKFIFSFDPRTSGDIGVSGVTKKFHEYWINNSLIAFDWMDEKKQNNSFYFYDVNEKKEQLSEENLIDFDDTGGFIGIESGVVYYKKPQGEQVSLGELAEHSFVNGISPSGKYIVILDNYKEIEEKPGVVGTYSVRVAKALEGGLKNAISVGEVSVFLGGMGGPVDPPFAEWNHDESKFTVRAFFVLEKDFSNPFTN